MDNISLISRALPTEVTFSSGRSVYVKNDANGKFIGTELYFFRDLIVDKEVRSIIKSPYKFDIHMPSQYILAPRSGTGIKAASAKEVANLWGVRPSLMDRVLHVFSSDKKPQEPRNTAADRLQAHYAAGLKESAPAAPKSGLASRLSSFFRRMVGTDKTFSPTSRVSSDIRSGVIQPSADETSDGTSDGKSQDETITKLGKYKKTFDPVLNDFVFEQPEPVAMSSSITRDHAAASVPAAMPSSITLDHDTASFRDDESYCSGMWDGESLTLDGRYWPSLAVDDSFSDSMSGSSTKNNAELITVVTSHANIERADGSGVAGSPGNTLQSFGRKMSAVSEQSSWSSTVSLSETVAEEAASMLPNTSDAPAGASVQQKRSFFEMRAEQERASIAADKISEGRSPQRSPTPSALPSQAFTGELGAIAQTKEHAPSRMASPPLRPSNGLGQKSADALHENAQMLVNQRNAKLLSEELQQRLEGRNRSLRYS